MSVCESIILAGAAGLLFGWFVIAPLKKWLDAREAEEADKLRKKSQR